MRTFKLVKRVPAKDYEAKYDFSIALVERIAIDTQEQPQSACATHLAYGREATMQMLLDGCGLALISPFGDEVLWHMEEEP